jgi:acyl carrier protein
VPVGSEILFSTEPEIRRSLVETYLIEQVTKVLKLPSPSLDPHQPISTMGFDSLMAIELKNQVEKDLKIIIPMVTFLEGPSVSQLTEMLLGELTAGAARSTVSPRGIRERTSLGLESDSIDDSWEEGVL